VIVLNVYYGFVLLYMVGVNQLDWPVFSEISPKSDLIVGVVDVQLRPADNVEEDAAVHANGWVVQQLPVTPNVWHLTGVWHTCD